MPTRPYIYYVTFPKLALKIDAVKLPYTQYDTVEQCQGVLHLVASVSIFEASPVINQSPS